MNLQAIGSIENWIEAMTKDIGGKVNFPSAENEAVDILLVYVDPE